MKKFLIVLLLAAAGAAAQAAPAGQQPTAAAPAAQKKIIQDPAEYNAYIAAANATDPTQKIQLVESYLQTYPNSVMKEDALELLLKAYQQQNKADQVKATAQKLLAVNPNNLTGLALLSYQNRADAQKGGPSASALLKEAGDLGGRGLQALATAPKPEGYSDEQWNTMRSSFKTIFQGSVGHAALQAKDYPTAQVNLKDVVAAQPNDVNSIYLLALSYLTPNPPVVDGLFWIARAAALSGNAQITNYAKNKYTRYHGDVAGFDELVAAAKASPTLPAGFTVAPAPTAADQANDMMKKGPPEKLSFGEWQFILTSGNKPAADAVWTAIKGKPVQLQANVIEASKDTLKLAGSVDDIEAKKADITLKLAEPLTVARVPKAGTVLIVQGVPAEYTAEGDNIMLSLTDGQVLKGLPEAPKKPAAGAHATHKAQ